MPHPMRVAPVDHAALSPRQQHVAVKMGRFGTAEASNLMRTALNYPEFARSIGGISTRVTLTSDLPPRPADPGLAAGLHAHRLAVR